VKNLIIAQSMQAGAALPRGGADGPHFPEEPPFAARPNLRAGAEFFNAYPLGPARMA